MDKNHSADWIDETQPESSFERQDASILISLFPGNPCCIRLHGSELQVCGAEFSLRVQGFPGKALQGPVQRCLRQAAFSMKQIEFAATAGSLEAPRLSLDPMTGTISGTPLNGSPWAALLHRSTGSSLLG